MSDEIDTTPNLRKPPVRLIQAAKRQIPGVMASIDPDWADDGRVQADGSVVMIAGFLAAKVRDLGHSEAAAKWAIHELVNAGLLFAAPRWQSPTDLPESLRNSFESDFALQPDVPAPYPNLVVVSKQELWDWWEKEEKSPAIQDEANTRKLFPNGAPNDTDIVDLVIKLDSAKGTQKTMSQVAREFTGETIGNDKKAKQLLARIRMMKSRGNLNL